MKAFFPLNALRTACLAIAPVVPSRTTNDILKNIKVNVTKESCSLSARDSEMSAIAFVRGVDCRTEGEILLPCDRLLQILREVSGETVSIDCDNGIAHVTVGRSKFKIPTEDPAKFEISLEFPETGYFSVPVADMKKIIKRCTIVAPTDKNAAFGGVHFEIKETLIAVSCDSKCMSLVECNYTKEGEVQEQKSQTLVPPKALKALSSMIPDEGFVDFSVTNNSITMRAGDFTVKSQLIAGMFPNWRRVVPKSCQSHVEIPAPQLSNAIRQSMITTEAESCCVEFQFSGGTLTLKSRGKGESTVELPVGFTGEQDFMMDPQFILNGLALTDRNASVDIGINDADSPVLITSSDGLRYVAMPSHRE